MPLLGTNTYDGDTGSYGVTIIKPRGTTTLVKIVQHDVPECTIPIGTIVHVPTDRII